MIEDAFELKEKSSAQLEMEKWTAEREREAAQTRAPGDQAAAKPRRFSGVTSVAADTTASAAHSSPAHTAAESQVASFNSPDNTPRQDSMLQETPVRPEAMTPQKGEERVSAAVAEDKGGGTTEPSDPVAEPVEASMQDMVIHQQRLQLEQLRRDKAEAEKERERLQTQVAMLQRSSKSASSADISRSDARDSSDGSTRRALDESLQPFLPQSLKALKAVGPVGWKRTLALAVLIFCAIWLVLRMFSRVEDEVVQDDVEWDLEIDHSEMQRLVAALAADKARVAKGSRDRAAGATTNSNDMLDHDLATVKTILNDLHRKSLKNHGHAAAQELLRKDNERLEQQLKQLRIEIDALRAQPSVPAKDGGALAGESQRAPPAQGDASGSAPGATVGAVGTVGAAREATGAEAEAQGVGVAGAKARVAAKAGVVVEAKAGASEAKAASTASGSREPQGPTPFPSAETEGGGERPGEAVQDRLIRAGGRS